MRTIGKNSIDYLAYLTMIDEQAKEKKNKKKNKTVSAPQPQVKDSYEQAMDTSRYDQILQELTS